MHEKTFPYMKGRYDKPERIYKLLISAGENREEQEYHNTAESKLIILYNQGLKESSVLQ